MLDCDCPNILLALFQWFGLGRKVITDNQSKDLCHKLVFEGLLLVGNLYILSSHDSRRHRKSFEEALLMVRLFDTSY
jgi:hypothetical protein